MNLTEEAILLNWAEMHRHRELARILRGIVEKQRLELLPPWHKERIEARSTELHTQNQDTNAEHESSAETCLFAPPTPHPSKKHITAVVTPEQASYAYKQAIAYRNAFSRRSSEPEGPPNATVSDSTRFEADNETPPIFWRDHAKRLWMLWSEGSDFCSVLLPKHRFVTLSGETRTEACCK